MWNACLHPGTDVLTLNCIPDLIVQLLNIAISFAGVVALFLLIWGAYKLAFSGGDPKQVEGARQTITYTLIGLVLVLLSYFILRLIGTLTGVDCFLIFGLDQCQ